MGAAAHGDGHRKVQVLCNMEARVKFEAEVAQEETRSDLSPHSNLGRVGASKSKEPLCSSTLVAPGFQGITWRQRNRCRVGRSQQLGVFLLAQPSQPLLLWRQDGCQGSSFSMSHVLPAPSLLKTWITAL